MVLDFVSNGAKVMPIIEMKKYFLLFFSSGGRS